MNHRPTVTILTVIGSWVFAAGSLGLIQILNGRDSDEHECSLSRVLNSEFPYAGALLALIQIGILTNISILTVFLIRHQYRMKSMVRSGTSKSDIRLCITVCIVSIVCTMLNVPWTLVIFYGTMVEWPSRFVRNAIFFLSTLTSIINPIIYTYRTRKFKALLQESTQLLYCCRK
ncbi:Hypothetical predicted protein [Mytilus galloprovincialis]|uniref:G-protein coupled receptors family 1 profile domain-containing protein n=1 Tax=Mytilus galloprovincialis TaxID=29158 RepID=A0A8B6G5R7_MYTGA|nr:Hypothetical predicted protein [Mytilus galloprovincialis]